MKLKLIIYQPWAWQD